MKQPECLHTPPLYEGESAQISWGVIETDTKYIVERAFNETFSRALTGYTWDNHDSTNESWLKYDQDSLNWTQIETRTGKGRTWENHDYGKLTWPQIENYSYTWQQLENRDISFEVFNGSGTERSGMELGRLWCELDELNESWSDKEAIGHSWGEGEMVTLPGISWDSIDSRWLTFAEWEQKDMTFYELDKQSHVERHRGMSDAIAIGATNAMYRIKAYAPNGEESSFLTTLQLPVIPIFYRSSAMDYPVQAGKRYRILMKAQDVQGLDKIRMNLRYNQYLLELTNFAAHSQSTISKPGNYQEEQLNIFSFVPGKIWFQSTKPLKQNECFSGSITLVEFIAKGTGAAEISLS